MIGLSIFAALCLVTTLVVVRRTRARKETTAVRERLARLVANDRLGRSDRAVG